MIISPKIALCFLSSVAGAFFIVFILLALSQTSLDAMHANGLLALWSVDAEVSIPTWYGQSILLVAAGLLFLIAKTVRRDKRYWYILAVVVLFASIDEGASVHELLIVPLRELLSISAGPLYYTWVIVYGLGLLAAMLFFLRFFGRLLRKTRLLLIAALTVFLAGALGMEMIGGWIISQPDIDWQYYALSVGLEELLEMLGVAILIYALLDYLSTHSRQVSVVVQKA